MRLLAQRGGRGIAPNHSQPWQQKGVGNQHHTLATAPTGNTQHPLCRKVDGPLVQPGQAWKISLPLGFNPQAVKVIMSCSTAYTNPAFISQTAVSQPQKRSFLQAYHQCDYSSGIQPCESSSTLL